MTSHQHHDFIEAPASRWTAELMRQGYCIIPGLARAESITAIDAQLAPMFAETPFCSGNFYGAATKRFGRLLSRAPNVADLVMHPQVLETVRAVLGQWCDTIQLNLSQAIALHPGALPQFPHRDQDMWQGVKGEVEYLVNVMWPLTEFREDNGATFIWPGSHGRQALSTEDPFWQPVIATCPPGSAILFLGSTMHGAGGNRTDDVRRGLIISYCLGWLKPYENQWLAYPPEIARNFPPELAALIGYQQHRPNLGNFEGQCPSILLGPEPVARSLAAIDALRPDQDALLQDYVEKQRARLAARKSLTP